MKYYYVIVLLCRNYQFGLLVFRVCLYYKLQVFFCVEYLYDCKLFSLCMFFYVVNNNVFFDVVLKVYFMVNKEYEVQIGRVCLELLIVCEVYLFIFNFVGFSEV